MLTLVAVPIILLIALAGTTAVRRGSRTVTVVAVSAVAIAAIVVLTVLISLDWPTHN